MTIRETFAKIAEDEKLSAEDKFDRMTKEYMLEQGEENYGKAFSIVYVQFPALHNEYLNSHGGA